MESGGRTAGCGHGMKSEAASWIMVNGSWSSVIMSQGCFGAAETWSRGHRSEHSTPNTSTLNPYPSTQRLERGGLLVRQRVGGRSMAAWHVQLHLLACRQTNTTRLALLLLQQKPPNNKQ